MAKAQTDPEVRDAVVVVLADLWRHVAQRASDGPENTTVKLPTRLKKLSGLDDLPASVAPQMLEAAGTMAELMLSALEAQGYVVIPQDWMVDG